MRAFLITIATLAFAAACKQAGRYDKIDLKDPTMIELLLDSSVVTKINFVAKPMVKAYYANNGYQMVWTKRNRFIKPADTLLNFILNAHHYGLISKEYHYDELEQLLQLPTDDVTRSRIDVLLTDAYFTIGHHLKHGRLNQRNLKPVLRINSVDSAAVTELRNALDKNSVRKHLELHEPQQKAYKALRVALREWIAEQYTDSTGVMKLSSNRKPVHSKKIQKAFINLERWRWEAHEWPGRYIIVNIPSYNLYVVENDEFVLQSKVIVGDTEHPSPVLSSTITCFVIYPYWHVPRSIATKELLPKIKDDASYLDRNNFQVLDREGNILDVSDIKWKKVDEENFSYLLRQREGTENSLGIIKFVFENRYGVYLHDTNSKRLFNNDYRALSHGCIRVEKAEALAHHLFYSDESSGEKLKRYIHARKRKELTLKEPIPLYLRYFTIDTFGDSTTVHSDVYQLDEKIMQSFNFNRTML